MELVVVKLLSDIYPNDPSKLGATFPEDILYNGSELIVEKWSSDHYVYMKGNNPVTTLLPNDRIKELYPASGAVLSKDNLYRYKLWRIWNTKLPYVMFVMYNPSTADHTKNDPTIKRCINFAKSWGYGGIYVGNVFAYRSTNPKLLSDVSDPIGEHNNIHLLEMIDDTKDIVCAWGNNYRSIPEILNDRDLRVIELSNNGIPKHPLYLKKDSELKLWETSYENSI